MALQHCPILRHGDQTFVSLHKPVIGHRWSPRRDCHSGWGRSLPLRAILSDELRLLSTQYSWQLGHECVGPEEGIWWSTSLCCSNPLPFYKKFALSGNIYWILVGLISWELANEGLVDNTIALASTVDPKVVTDVFYCPSLPFILNSP